MGADGRKWRRGRQQRETAGHPVGPRWDGVERTRTRWHRRTVEEEGEAGAEAAACERSPRREILLSWDGGTTVAAVLEDGETVEIDLERRQGRRLVGNIYKGRVQNVLPGMQAAFVDIGLDRNAFLFVDDADPGSRPEPDGPTAGWPRPGDRTIAGLVYPGQELLVQVTKEPSGTKGARVTRALTLPGRYLVLLAGVDDLGVSRSIVDQAERSRLRQVAQRVRPAGTGMIVRTAAEDVGEQELETDWRALTAAWIGLETAARSIAAPALVHRDLDVLERVVRDQLRGDIVRIVVDDPEELERLRVRLQQAAPMYADRLQAPTAEQRQRGLLASAGVEDALTIALGRRVPLPSGGYLVIDQTEALTAIDVNTGRFVGTSSSLEDTFVTTNLEAATAIARQLRLRDIGGIIVIDFIDMESVEHRRQVLDALERGCAPDRSQPRVLDITALGLVEMTRRKARQSLRERMTRPCAVCEGTGRVAHEEVVSRRIRRELRSLLGAATTEALLVEVHPAVAAMVIGPGGEGLRSLEQESGRTLFIRGVADCPVGEMHLRASGSRAEVEAEARPVRPGQTLELRVEEPHASTRSDGIARLEGYVVDIEGGAAFVGKRVRIEITRVFRTYARARLAAGPSQ